MKKELAMLRSVFKFTRNSSGSVAQLAALTAVPLLIASGGAIDFGRWNSAHVELSEALDAAVLAGAQELKGTPESLAKAEKAANDYFKVAVTGAQKLGDLSVKFIAAKNFTRLEGSAKGLLPTSLLTLAGMPSIEVNAFSVAENGVEGADSDLEISLVLDVTGSMCDDGNGPCSGGTKMNALKTSANKLVDTVVWDDQSKFTSRVAIVPFNHKMRVGPDGSASGQLMKKLTGLDPTWSGWMSMCTNGGGGGGSSETNGGGWCNSWSSQYMSNWKIMPCVGERYYNNSSSFDYTDEKPGNNKWMLSQDGSRAPESYDSSNTKMTSNLGKSSNDPMVNWAYSPDGVCYDVDPANELMPLSSTKAALKAKINGLVAHGGTGGVLGTSFGWYTISPNWTSIWPAGNQPKPYSQLKLNGPSGKPKLRKISIIMTDGAYNAYRTWKEQDVNMVSDAAKKTCKAMKDAGIEIYTIGFDLDSLPAYQKTIAVDVLKSCGTTVDHFYNSLNASQLQAAFDSIGAKVSSTSLRLVE